MLIEELRPVRVWTEGIWGVLEVPGPACYQWALWVVTWGSLWRGTAGIRSSDCWHSGSLLCSLTTKPAVEETCHHAERAISQQTFSGWGQHSLNVNAWRFHRRTRLCNKMSTVYSPNVFAPHIAAFLRRWRLCPCDADRLRTWLQIRERKFAL